MCDECPFQVSLPMQIPSELKHDSRSTIYYELQSTRPLPRVDLTRSLKHVIIPQWAQKPVTCVLRHWITHTIILIMFGIGVVLGSLAIFGAYQTKDDSWMIYISVTAILISWLLTLMGLRLDMVMLAFTTFDFWYMTINNYVLWIMMCITLHDPRGAIALAAGMLCELAVLADATVRSGNIVVGTAMTTLLSLVHLTGFAVGWIRTQRVVLIHWDKRTLDANDALVNSLITVIILLIRNTYRKYHNQIRQRKHLHGSVVHPSPTLANTTKLVSYRCRLGLVEVSTASSVAMSTIESRDITRIQLELVPEWDLVEPHRVMNPSMYRFFLHHTRRQTIRIIVHVIGLIGLVTMPLALCLQSEITDTLAFSIFSLIATTATCLIVVTLFHRGLFSHLLWSFDCAFVSIQVTICSLCLADMIHYDHRMMAVIANWLWIHLILYLDAITPTRKEQFGFHGGLISIVVFVCLVQLIIIAIDLVTFDILQLYDRKLYTFHVGETVRTITVAPIYFSRVVSLAMWFLRILWRLYDREPHELYMLQGRVQFHVPTKPSFGIK